MAFADNRVTAGVIVTGLGSLHANSVACRLPRPAGLMAPPGDAEFHQTNTELLLL